MAGDSVIFPLPSLPPGLFWVTNLLTSGSIAVGGNGGGGSPTLTLSRSGSTLNLTWSTSTLPGLSSLYSDEQCGYYNQSLPLMESNGQVTLVRQLSR